MFDEKFLEDNLEKVLGVSFIPKDKKQEVLKAMQEHIQKRVATVVMEKLSMKDKMKLMPIMMKKDPEKIMHFMMEKIPNFPDIVRNEMQSFRAKALEIINS